MARTLDRKAVIRFRSGLELRIGNLAAMALLAGVAILLAAAAIGAGATDAGLRELLAILTGANVADDQRFAVSAVRLPRILLGFMAGWAVALAGAMLQSLARNPLADPGLLGVSQGAMTTIMVLMILAPAAPQAVVALAALGGSLGIALLLVWLVGGARSSGQSILLMGIAVESVLSSVGSILLLYTPPAASLALADWMAGSLFQASWDGVATFAPLLGFSLAGLFLAGRSTSTFELGNEMAMSVGEPVRWSRPLILFFAVLLSGAAVVAVGPLMFLGVLAPQLAGFISPASGRVRLLLSALVGGILVVAADALARAAAADIPLPIGLGLTLIGVPFFIVALRLQAARRFNAS